MCGTQLAIFFLGIEPPSKLALNGYIDLLVGLPFLMKYQKVFFRVVAFWTFLAFHSGTVVAEADNSQIKNAVVKIFTDSAARNLVHPWKVDPVVRSTGSGVILDGNRILTAAHVIKDGVAIYVRKVGSDKRYPATASYVSDASELAVLTVADDQFFQDVSTLTLGLLPELGDAVTVWGFPKGGDQIAITKGIVSRIDFDMYAHSGFDNLVCQVDAAINPGASGGAAVVDGRLIGISFQSLKKDDADNVGYIIPVPVINQFLDDIKDGVVHGVPALAAKFQNMKNPQLREFYGMTLAMGGVLVTEIPGGKFDVESAIKVGDVLLGVDGVEVGNDGTAPFQSGDRIDAHYFVTRHQIGDTIPIRLLRDRKVFVVDFKLKHKLGDLMLVARTIAGFVPDYEIVGGLVFQELNDGYIMNAFSESGGSGGDVYDGPAWMETAYSSYKSQRVDARETAVFISNILADEINVGYEAFEDQRVDRVNAIRIFNLEDLRRALAGNDAPFHIIDFKDSFGQIVLNRQLVQERESIISERYQLSD